jgi:protein-tyrosine phosphatase
MIDIHCHILPGMDDGPEHLDAAIRMCRMAAADGVRTIVATPHFSPGSNEFDNAMLTAAQQLLQAAVQKDGLDLSILIGAEVAVTPELDFHLKQHRFLAINGGRYFLAEFRPLSVPANWDTFLISMMASGFVPIIAHPERNLWFMNHPEALPFVVKNGVMLQVTAASITGGLGPDVRDFCSYLLKRNLVHIIASDAHSADFRPPRLSEAMELAADIIGAERAEAMVTSVPDAIISDKDIRLSEPLAHVLPEEGRARTWMQKLFN